MGAQLHGFYSLPKPGKHQLPGHDDSPQEACYVLPRGYSSEAPTLSGLGDAELENEEVYTFKTPCNALATMHSNERPTDNYDLPTTPGSFYQIPRTFDKNHNALTPSSSESSCAPPPRPPKPSQSEGQWGSPHSVGSQNGEVTSAVSVIPRRNTLPAVENIRLHRGTPNSISAYLLSQLVLHAAHVVKQNLSWLIKIFLKSHISLVSCFSKCKSDLIGPFSRGTAMTLCFLFLPLSFSLLPSSSISHSTEQLSRNKRASLADTVLLRR